MVEHQPGKGPGREADDIVDWMAKRRAAVRRRATRMPMAAKSVARAPRPSAADRQTDRPRPVGTQTSIRKAAQAGAAGLAAGVPEGALGAVQDQANLLSFGTRLLNPFDRLVHPGQPAPADALIHGAAAAADYAAHGSRHPKIVARDAKRLARQTLANLMPAVPTAAATPRQAFEQNFRIGQNDGRLAFDLAGLASGSRIAGKIAKLGIPAEEIGVRKYLAQGFRPAQAEYLAQPYTRLGHHSPVPQAVLKRLKIPRALGDSAWNTIKPPGISRGEFYELHQAMDKYFYGTKLNKGAVWSSKKLGLKKFGAPARVWHGTPEPIKAVLGGLLGLGYGAAGAARRTPMTAGQKPGGSPRHPGGPPHGRKP